MGLIVDDKMTGDISMFGADFDPKTLKIPSSWEREDVVADLSSKLDEALATTAKGATGKDEGITGKEKKLMDAVMAHKVRATDPAGRMFEAMKKVDDVLKKEYAQAKTREAQNDVRFAWASRYLKELQTKRWTREEQEVSQLLKGRYKPFGNIYQDEGADPAAYKAAVEIVKSCIMLHKEGRTINSKKFLKYNWMSKRTEFLHLEEGFEEFARHLEGQTSTEKPATDSADAKKEDDDPMKVNAKIDAKKREDDAMKDVMEMEDDAMNEGEDIDGLPIQSLFSGAVAGLGRWRAGALAPSDEAPASEAPQAAEAAEVLVAEGLSESADAEPKDAENEEANKPGKRKRGKQDESDSPEVSEKNKYGKNSPKGSRRPPW